MNKSSIVFGGYDKKILDNGVSNIKIDETEQSDDESDEHKIKSKIEEETSQDELMSVNKAHLDIRTNTRLGNSETESNFFDD